MKYTNSFCKLNFIVAFLTLAKLISMGVTYMLITLIIYGLS